MNTLSPGKPYQGMVRVRSPNDMVAFVNLLVHLCDLGFLRHWILDHARNMLADKVVTRVIPARRVTDAGQRYTFESARSGSEARVGAVDRGVGGDSGGRPEGLIVLCFVHYR